MAEVRKLGMVLHPVDDLEKALRFWQDALGLSQRFRDGNRFCALDAAGVTIALAAGEERITDAPAVSLQVDDVDAVVAKLEAAGAQVVSAPADGPHERRAVLRDPAGNPLVLYARR